MTTIDNKVVEMRLDNSQFESNARTSLSTLSALNKGLKLDGAANGLATIASTARGLNFDGLGTAVDTIKTKFSAMEVVAVTALVRIADKALGAGERLVRSLSIDQITSGWQKYADKTSSVQTIMAATAKDFNNTEEQMEMVNKQLSKLNWFTDETSYSFTDMVNNIGKFTSNNIALDKSVTAMQGISTWAALSGANVGEAGRAMYNLSQALSAGSVKLTDWRSIELANMGTSEFKQTVIDTAAEMGVLRKEADGTYRTIDGKTEVSAQKFSATLSEGWFTSDVLLSTLNKFGGFSDKLYYASEETNMTATELLSALDKYKSGSLNINEMAKETGVSASRLKEIFSDLGSETMNLGKRSFAAAQEAKTFREAIDATKDAVSTGWMNTFELLFGNYNEAKKLWTSLAGELYDIFASGAEARNELLKGWKDLGGRDLMLESISNAWENFKNILGAVKNAFRDVFPAMTPEKLVDITKKVRDLTEKFKLNESSVDKLRSTFKGLFSIVSIIGKVFSAALMAITPVFDWIRKGAQWVLNLAASIGEWIFKMDQSITSSSALFKVSEKVMKFLEQIPGKLKGIFSKFNVSPIGDIFQKLADGIKDGFESLKSSVSMFDGIKSAFNKLGEFFSEIYKSLSKTLSPFASMVKDTLGKIFNELKEIDILSIFDNIAGGALVGLGFKELIKAFQPVTDAGAGIGGIINSVKSLFDGVKESLMSWQTDIKGKTLITIATAVGILTASIAALATLDPGKVRASLAAVTAEFIVLMKSLEMLGKVTSASDVKRITTAATTMVVVSGAILMLTSALKSLSQLNWDELAKGMVGLAGVSATLVIVAKQLSTTSGHMMKGTGGLILFAGAIKILAGVVDDLGDLSFDQLIKGLAGVGALCLELMLFLKGANLDGISLGKGLGLMTLAAAINILADAVGAFSSMDLNSMLKGLGAVGVLLAELAIFTKLTNNAKGVLSTSTGLVVLGGAMLVFSKAIEQIGSLNLETIGKGLLGIGASLGIVTAAMNLLPKDTLVKSAGMLVMAAALKDISKAVNDFGDMSWNEVAKGLVTLAGSLAIITVALIGMTGTLAGSAALLIAANALKTIVPPFKELGSMSLGEIGKGLLAMAGAFTVLGLAGAALGPLAPAILALSAAVVAFGVGALAAGTGILALSTALTALATLGTAGVLAIKMAITELLTLLPNIATALAESIGQMIITIADMSTQIVAALVELGSAILTGANELIPQLVETVINIIDSLLATIAEHLPSIIESGVSILLSLLQGIRDSIGEVATVVADIIIEFMRALSEKQAEIIQAGIDIVINFIDGLAQGIETNTARVKEAFTNLFNSIINAIKELLGIHSPSTVLAEIGVNMIEGLINGIGQMMGAALNKMREVLTGLLNEITSKLVNFKNKGVEVVSNMVSGIGSKIGDIRSKISEVVRSGIDTISSKVSEFRTKGSELIDNLKTGIGNKANTIATALSSVVQNGLGAIQGKFGEFASVGSNLVAGLRSGIESAAYSVVNAATSVVNGAIGAAKRLLGIASPSKVFRQFGIFVDEGFVNGLTLLKGKVADASADVAQESIDSASATLSGLDSLLSDEVSTNPTITPVLDLSEITTGITQMDKMLDTTHAIAVSNRADSAFNSMRSANMSSTDTLSPTKVNKIQNETPIYNTFNITGDNPKEIAQEVSRIIQTQFERKGAAWA